MNRSILLSYFIGVVCHLVFLAYLGLGQIKEPLGWLYDGLTYCGDIFHTFLNGSTLAITFFCLIYHFPKSKTFAALVLFAGIQWNVWLVANSIGFSLIWSGFLGVLCMIIREQKSASLFPLLLPLCLGWAVVIFYAVALPFISTVAHMIAILCGAGWTFFSHSNRSEKQQKNNEIP